MQYYKIAGISIEISSVDHINLARFHPFIDEIGSKPDIAVKIHRDSDIPFTPAHMVLNEGLHWARDKNGSPAVYITTDDPDQIAYLMKTNAEWDMAEIHYRQDRFNAETAATGPLGEILFRNRLILKDGLVIHASAIDCGGKGILFSAPSGTGKSTQALLWQVSKNASLVNNDRPALRIFGDDVYAFNTPWSDVQPSGLNINCTKVHGIVMLEQAQINTIRELSLHEALLRLGPRCFLPFFDGHLMNIAMKSLENILQRVPVFLLRCRPDQEAVHLVYDTMFTQTSQPN